MAGRRQQIRQKTGGGMINEKELEERGRRARIIWKNNADDGDGEVAKSLVNSGDIQLQTH